MEIIFLGTSSMVPTKERNHTSILLTYNTDGILFDCGEGTQRQLSLAGIRPTKITKILITHWHGDHVLGIPGLIQTLGSQEYSKTLEIYGPKGTKKFMEKIFEAFIFDKKISLKIIEVDDGAFFENEEYILESKKLEHGIICLGYSFIEKDKKHINIDAIKKLKIPEGPLLGKLVQNKSIVFNGEKITPKETTYVQKGKKLSFISDTNPCSNCNKLAQDSDILICESTYSSKLKDKSETYNHMTSRDAALIANNSNVKKLILTHFSARYKNTQELEEDARDVFNNTIAAKDFMRVLL